MYGDHCFREPFAGKSPDHIRRELAAAARASIRRSIDRCVGPRELSCDWPWLRTSG